MKANPTVSVIVPAFNAAGTIKDTLRSALAQTLQDIEVIVVDDGSTDETVRVVARMAERDPRVRLVCQENAGVAAARNTAIASARGTYVAPLDADDVWYPDKLAVQVARMERDGPGMGMVYTWWVGVDEATAIRGSSFPSRVEGDVALCLLYVNFIGCASSPLYRLEVVERVGGYDPNLRDQGAQGCEDWDLSLRVAAHYEVGVAPGYHVGYRRVPGTMSGDVGTMARSYYAVMDRIRDTWSGVPPAVYQWSEANFATYLASQSYRAGRFADAVRWVMRALRCDPALVLARSPYLILARSLVHLAGGDWLTSVVREYKSPPHLFTLEEIGTKRTKSRWNLPWARSNGPHSLVRPGRLDRLRNAPPPVRTEDGPNHIARESAPARGVDA